MPDKDIESEASRENYEPREREREREYPCRPHLGEHNFRHVAVDVSSAANGATGYDTCLVSISTQTIALAFQYLFLQL